MTEITFHGGVNDIGGNKFLIKDRDTKIFMDFGKSFSAEGDYFSEYVKPRSSDYLHDMFGLKLLPDVPGLYREDYVKHMFGKTEDRGINAIFLTHAHLDHCEYIKYVRSDIPIYCSEETKAIMQTFDETGKDAQLTKLKRKFQWREKKRGSGMMRADACDDGMTIDRDIHIINPGERVKLDSMEIHPIPVDHSLPGVFAYILYGSEGSVANTADLRFHGRRKSDTEEFVKRCGDTDLDLLLCEGTRVDNDSSGTEEDVELNVKRILEGTDGLAICTYPMRDLDRILSFYNAAKAAGRKMIIDLKQAHLLDLFTKTETLKANGYPAPDDEHIKIYLQKGSWGTLDSQRNLIGEELGKDYSGNTWIRQHLERNNLVDYNYVREHAKDVVLYCSDWKIQTLLDIKPDENCVYIRSQTEAFNAEMDLGDKRVKNWLVSLGIIRKEENWCKFHVSGHGDGHQIRRVIDGAKAKALIPIHTKNPQYHKKWHKNVTIMDQGGTYSV